jgi:hypothetical protein
MLKSVPPLTLIWIYILTPMFTPKFEAKFRVVDLFLFFKFRMFFQTTHKTDRQTEFSRYLPLPIFVYIFVR